MNAKLWKGIFWGTILSSLFWLAIIYLIATAAERI
jgi:hypothetical protein